MILNSAKRTIIYIVFVISLIGLIFYPGTKAIDLSSNTYNRWEWTVPDVATDTSNENSFGNKIAADSQNNIHIVWSDSTDLNGAGTDEDIFYRMWNSTSLSWSAISTVSLNTQFSAEPEIVIDKQDNVHVVWLDITDYLGSGTDGDIFYRMKNASTSIWTTTEVVSTESTSTSAFNVVTVDYQMNVHVAWIDSTDYLGAGTDQDVFYKMFNRTTSSWTTTEVVSENLAGTATEVDISIDNLDNIHIVWEDTTDYLSSGLDGDIFYRRYDSQSFSWNTIVVISDSSTDSSLRPSITITNQNNVHVVWVDDTDLLLGGTDRDLFYREFDYSQMSWRATKLISSSSTGLSHNPDISADTQNNLHVVWEDNTNITGAGTDLDIFYSRYDLESGQWSEMELISSQSTSSAGTGAIAVSTFLYITWVDDTNYLSSGADFDIFFTYLSGEPLAPSINLSGPNPSFTGEVDFSWQSILGAESYNIYRDVFPITSIFGMTPHIALEDPGSASYVYFTESLLSSGDYYYAVTSENQEGESDPSNYLHIRMDLEDLVVTQNVTVTQTITVTDQEVSTIIQPEKTVTIQDDQTTITVTKDGSQQSPNDQPTQDSLPFPSSMILVPIFFLVVIRGKLKKYIKHS